MTNSKTIAAVFLIIWWILFLFNQAAIKKEHPTEDRKETQLEISIY